MLIQNRTTNHYKINTGKVLTKSTDKTPAIYEIINVGIGDVVEIVDSQAENILMLAPGWIKVKTTEAINEVSVENTEIESKTKTKTK